MASSVLLARDFILGKFPHWGEVGKDLGHLSQTTIRAISVFRVKFNVEFTCQAVNFS